MCGLGQISLSFGFSPNILSMIVDGEILQKTPSRGGVLPTWHHIPPFCINTRPPIPPARHDWSQNILSKIVWEKNLSEF